MPSNIAPQLATRAILAMEVQGAPQLEETLYPSMESAEEDLLHQYNEDALDSTPLDVVFPYSPLTLTIVIANPSIIRGEVLEGVIPLDFTPLRSRAFDYL